MKMDPMMLDERLKAVQELHNAALCVRNLEKALRACITEYERERVLSGIEHFKAETKRHGERLFQLAASGNRATVKR